MKSLKPFVLVLAGMLITIALFSFKNEMPKKEYLTAYNYANAKFVITKPDLTPSVINRDKGEDAQVFDTRVINDLTKEGWELKIRDAGQYYFERTKQ